ncbi:unnamed protein product [Natator depressus]
MQHPIDMYTACRILKPNKSKQTLEWWNPEQSLAWSRETGGVDFLCSCTTSRCRQTEMSRYKQVSLRGDSHPEANTLNGESRGGQSPGRLPSRGQYTEWREQGWGDSFKS